MWQMEWKSRLADPRAHRGLEEGVWKKDTEERKGYIII